jgi:hypothetical protein
MTTGTNRPFDEKFRTFPLYLSLKIRRPFNKQQRYLRFLSKDNAGKEHVAAIPFL